MTTLRRVFTRTALVRLAVAWAAVIALALAGGVLTPPVAGPVLVIALVVIVGVILLAAFGVVHEAEELAHKLGDPYGSLVLTLSIVAIEVILISSVMLGPGEHATIARDSVSAVMMIIVNLVIGVAILVGARRHGAMRVNRTGTSTYLAMIVFLTALAFGLPAVLDGGTYAPAQAVAVVLVTVALYAWFLIRQTGKQAADYHEVEDHGVEEEARAPIGEILREHRAELLARVGLLLATMIPIVLMSHDMAGLLDDGLGRIGAPVALAGVLIAIIVFTPETITSIRAAAGGEIQRVVNLCLGAFVSTVGLTIPAVLTIGLLTGQVVVLAESPAILVLIVVSLVASVVTFTAPKVTAIHGAVHVALFAVYGVMLLG